MRMTVVSCGVLATVALAAPASAAESAELQAAMADPWVVTREAPATVSDLLTRIDRDARFTAGDRPAYAWYHRGEARVVFDFTITDGQVQSIICRAAPDALARVVRRSGADAVTPRARRSSDQ